MVLAKAHAQPRECARIYKLVYVENESVTHMPGSRELG